MAAISSLILVGSAHPNNGGIRSFAQISLEEGGRAALSLRWINPMRTDDGDFFRKFTMIPTIENMVDDSILMVAYAICRSLPIFTEVNRMTSDLALSSGRLNMNEDFTLEQREDLYSQIKKLNNLPKIVWCVFDGSSIKSSMIHLLDYQLECEVNQSIYSNTYSRWTDSMHQKGVIS